MTWCVVSFITVIEVLNDEQTEFPVQEDFYLFEFQSDGELEEKIEKQINIINAAGVDGVRYYGKNAKEYFLGVRKIKTIFNEPPLDMDEDPPADGTELTHSYMTVKSLKDARRLAEGKAVYVHYIDDDPLNE
ncbi:hypothetical protein AYL20_09430 [Acinetobacter venetianus]|uniref:hypothetical protein n=1 Tax=Acinetobacter venetianus TaxID=52133 RepID=UPI000775F2E6|nr:hypothetical protein [Acinetobacter venetianus]KXO76973.1 hypothetical protein AYL20_09430 [Acinetobacter venetianus]